MTRHEKLKARKKSLASSVIVCRRIACRNERSWFNVLPTFRVLTPRNASSTRGTKNGTARTPAPTALVQNTSSAPLKSENGAAIRVMRAALRGAGASKARRLQVLLLLQYLAW